MKWLKIITFGITVRTLSLVWPDFDLVLPFPVAIGLAMTIPVYFLGRAVVQSRSGHGTEPNFYTRQTPFYVYPRHAHLTVPITSCHPRNVHSRPPHSDLR